jgi:hypothetical protein
MLHELPMVFTSDGVPLAGTLVRMERQGRTDRFLRSARIREPRRGPRRRLVRGDIMDPDDIRGAVMSVVGCVDARK